MRYRLGIDLGTTFTAAAVLRDGADPEAVALGERTQAAPTVMYLNHDGSVLYGDAAEGRATEAPERIARHFKLRIGDKVPLMLGRSTEDHIECYAHDLAAAMIAWVIHTVAGREGAQPEAIALTHPAAWDRRKLDLLRGALDAQHLGPITLITEPEAAAIGYAHACPIEHPATLAVYDLGGGTLDVALLATTANGRFTQRGQPQELAGLGGIDVDEQIEAMVSTSVRFFHETVAAAGLGARDLSCVLLTGGSVQVPLVTESLSKHLPEHVRILRAADAKAMVAAGAVLSLQIPVTNTAPTIPPARTAPADLAMAQARASDASTSAAAPARPPARPPARHLAETPAPATGHAFFDEAASDGDDSSTQDRPQRSLRRSAGIGAVVVLAAASGIGAALWLNQDSPRTETPTTVVTPSPAPVTPKVTTPLTPKQKRAAKARAERAAASASPAP